MTIEPPTKKLKMDNDSSDEELPDYLLQPTKPTKNSSLYLNTINRHLLDFDLEKVCLVTLSNTNVYSCLVCGKYFQGRSNNSPAYLHSIDTNHYVYLNLLTEKFYILPDNYEIANDGLNDIVKLLNPRYTIVEEATDLNGIPYSPGYIGLDNLSNNDYSNVILQLLAHILPIRDYYLQNELDSKFGLLVRKLWSPFLYKNHTSPHEFLQLVSQKTSLFPINVQKSPKRFLVWLLNHLKTKVLSATLQGSLRVTTFPVVAQEINQQVQYKTTKGKSVLSKFWILTLDLPPFSVFQQDAIPEVDITELLAKYNGRKTTPVGDTELRTYALVKPLPEYILVHIDRKLEEGGIRGNPTVVTFPSVLDFGPYTQGAPSTLESLKGDTTLEPLNYELVANIEHELITGLEIDHHDDRQNWLIHLQQNKNTWVMIKDSKVSPCQRELLFAKESYIQVWKRMNEKSE